MMSLAQDLAFWRQTLCATLNSTEVLLWLR